MELNITDEPVFTCHGGFFTFFFLNLFVSLRRWTLMIPQLLFGHGASTCHSKRCVSFLCFVCFSIWLLKEKDQ